MRNMGNMGNKRFGRKMAVLLAAALLCGGFAGCGKQEQTEDTSQNSAADGEEASRNEAKDLTADIAKKEPDEAADAEYDDSWQFAQKLFAEALEEKNPVLSPISAYLALALAGEGAENGTAEEFDKVLGENRGEISGSLMESLPADREDIQVKLANSAWTDDEMDVVEAWLDAAKNIYAARVFQEDLSTEKTRRNINWWVEENTGGLIRNFLSEPLDEDCRLALFNTVYFKGKWVTPFEALDTYERPFTLESGNVVNVQTMNLYRESLKLLKTDFCEGIVLPYRDSNLVFVAIKPAGDDGDSEHGGKTSDSKIRELVRRLDAAQIEKIAASAAVAEVNLHLPKFEVVFDRKLNDDLIDMGLAQAFDENLADFSGLGTGRDGAPVYIDLVRQKAVFTLDEEGTEAAAVTEVAMFDTTAMLDETMPVEMDFNEPFVYMVLDPVSQMPLFVGIMDNPVDAQAQK